MHTDQKRLRQILINLLSNAVKYTETGDAALTVRYRNQVAEFEISRHRHGHLAWTTSSACSSPSSAAGDAARRARIPGTGLGLTITKLLMQVMGGEISVRSDAGRRHHLHRAAAAVRGPARSERRRAASAASAATPASRAACC